MSSCPDLYNMVLPVLSSVGHTDLTSPVSSGWMVERIKACAHDT